MNVANWTNVAAWNWFDWLLAAIMSASAILAFITGLVRAVAGLLGIVVGLEIANWSYIAVGDRIRDQGWIPTEFMARIVAYLAIVSLAVVVSEVVGRVMRKSLRVIGAGWIDRLLGAVFGFARGSLIGVILLIAAAAFAPKSDVVASSVLRPYLFTVVSNVSFLIPNYFQQRIL